MLGDTNHLHHYFRPSPDGTRILFGGDTKGALHKDARVEHRHLQKEMISIFPELEGVGLSHIWWGYVAMNVDHLPQMAIKNGIYYPTGFCGSGVVWGRWFGRKAALKIIGDPAGDSAFEGQKFSAIPFYKGNPWFLPGVLLWYKLRDTLNI
jgi:glycine/D-amino acid oxidase-like deaminating enzyme